MTRWNCFCYLYYCTNTACHKDCRHQFCPLLYTPFSVNKAHLIFSPFSSYYQTRLADSPEKQLMTAGIEPRSSEMRYSCSPLNHLPSPERLLDTWRRYSFSVDRKLSSWFGAIFPISSFPPLSPFSQYRINTNFILSNMCRRLQDASRTNEKSFCCCCCCNKTTRSWCSSKVRMEK